MAVLITSTDIGDGLEISGAPPKLKTTPSIGAGGIFPNLNLDGDISNTPGTFLVFGTKHTKPSNETPIAAPVAGTINFFTMSNEKVGVAGTLQILKNGVVAHTWAYNTGAGVTDFTTGINLAFVAGDLISVRAITGAGQTKAKKFIGSMG